MKKLVTHNGKFHLDEVFACATIALCLEKQGEPYEIVRTRDKSIAETGDYVVDIGDVYDPEHNRFDHHQKGGAGARGNAIPYASFGLVWKKFGIELCGDPEIVATLDEDMASGIDAIDNGISITTDIFPDVKSVTFAIFAASFEPSWKNPDLGAFDAAFRQLFPIAKDFLARRIAHKIDKKEAELLVLKAYHDAPDKRIIVLDRYYPRKSILATFPEPTFVIFPNEMDKSWMAATVRDEDTPYVNKKSFPESWGGLRGEAFAKETGVADAQFCHLGLWIVTAGSKEGAIALAERALNA